MREKEKSLIPLLLLLSKAQGTESPPSTLSTIQGPPRHLPRTAPPLWTSTSTVYVTVMEGADLTSIHTGDLATYSAAPINAGVSPYGTSTAPLAQTGDLATYGAVPADAAVSAEAGSAHSSTTTEDVTMPVPLSAILPGTSNTAMKPSFLIPLPSVFSPALVASITIHQPIPLLCFRQVMNMQGVASLTLSRITTSVTVSAAGDTSTLLSSPPPTTATSATMPPTTRKSGPTFGISGVGGLESLPSTIPIEPAFSAMVHCASVSGGLRPDGAIGKGCDSLFSHIMSCFTANEPWDSPDDSARTDAYRTCVCMSSNDNPFSEYSALWKNFSGCAACLHSDIGGVFDCMPWLNLEARRMWSFCRSQEPNAFLFTLFLKDWYYRLTNYSEISEPPFAAAFSGGTTEGGMSAMQAKYTGRPPLANIAWGASGLPSGQYSGMSPSLSTYVTTVETQGAMLTTPASTMGGWITVEKGQLLTASAVDAMESMAMDRLLSSALCLNTAPCRLSEASRQAPVWPAEWTWAVSIVLAVVVGGAACWL